MMDEKIIRSMKKDERDLAACTEKLEQTRQLLRAGREEEAGEILRAIAMLGNELTVRHRQMVMDTGDPNARADVERIIAQIHPVEIGFTPEGWFGLRMEPLARTRDTASKEYIRGIIYPAMRRFFADKATVRYPRCTLIFRHVYDRNTPEAQYRDYNNAEVKLVTDTVAMYVMVDDDPLHCNVFHCSAPGPESRTEVYVVPREDFAAWFAMEPGFPDEGVRLEPQVPDAWKVDD